MIKFRDLMVVLVGYIICFYLMDLSWSLFQETNIWLRLLIVDLVGTIFIYICSNIFRNSSWYDAYWSVIPPFLILLVWMDVAADSGNKGSARGVKAWLREAQACWEVARV